ncbi:protein SSUH2 homolog isoform X2 [Microcaecilia unicolor]|uniref:Protein SSUH2 homolog isoform X2 n=1 Tax=Microcaecilia unicolor TaxID=1415580 RepID=A0A6P7YH65_9AMPH|nr:protein SSUH2 homolog isoform X2 [Microcaecilia unicolor]
MDEGQAEDADLGSPKASVFSSPPANSRMRSAVPSDCSVPVVTEEMATEALFQFINSKCCYSREPLAKLTIEDIIQLSLYRYRLETFSECRFCEWSFEPYTGQLVDGPENGASPQPWDVQVSTPNMFQEDTRRLRISHSSHVKVCSKCQGRGRKKCSRCQGAGRARCVSCSRSRHRDKHKTCQICSGTGRRSCNTCSGRGHKPCTTCRGERRLLHFRQLTITWKNNVFEFVPEMTQEDAEAFPRELLSKVHGRSIFKEEGVLVHPITDFPNSEISQVSLRAITTHRAAHAENSPILQQRQRVEWIPLTVVHYQYKGQHFAYYLYGMENRVHAPDYPKKHCCRCDII